MNDLEMPVNWINDDAGVAVAKSNLGLVFTEELITPEMIDRKLSAQNRARSYSVNKERAASIAIAMLSGTPIPKIIARKVKNGDGKVKYVIAGGNHREHGYSQVNKMSAFMPVHVIECTDSEFEVLCGLLNTVVGEGMTKEERLDRAVDAVQRFGLPQKEAAVMYGLSPHQVSAHKAFVSFKNKFQIDNSISKTLIQSIKEDQRKNGPVADAWGEAVNAVKFSSQEINEISKKVDQAGLETEKVAIIHRHVEEKKKESARKIKRPKYKALKMALGGICKQMDKLQAEKGLQISLSSFDVLPEEEKEVRELCKKVSQFLSSL